MNSIVTQRFIKCHDKLREENRVRSSRQFALSLDYLPQSLSEILKGRRDVTIELIRKAVEVYKLNPVYLYTGEGPPFMTEGGNQDVRILTVVTNAQDQELIVHVPSAAQGAYVQELGNPQFIQNLPHFLLPEYRYQAGTIRSFDVTGDAMEPTLSEGDKLVCQYVEPGHWETGIRENHIHVVVTRADVLVRRVANNLREKKQLRIFSDNDYYSEQILPLADIRELWVLKTRISPYMGAPSHPVRKVREDIKEVKQALGQQSQLIHNLLERIDKLSPDRS